MFVLLEGITVMHGAETHRRITPTPIMRHEIVAGAKRHVGVSAAVDAPCYPYEVKAMKNYSLLADKNQINSYGGIVRRGSRCFLRLFPSVLMLILLIMLLLPFTFFSL